MDRELNMENKGYVNISEAIKLAGVSRSHFYKKYIKQGVLSVESAKDGSKRIQVAELIRVFGELKGDTEYTVSESKKEQEETPKKDTEYIELKGEYEKVLQLAQQQQKQLELLEKEAARAEKFENLYIDLANKTTLLLEDQREKKGFFRRIFAK